MKPFTLLVLGDTQYLFDGERRRPELLKETFTHVRRLVDSGAVAPVRHVIHVGDVTEHGWAAEAAAAVEALAEGKALLGGVGMTIATGNHDVAHLSDDARGTTPFLEAFGPGCALLNATPATSEEPAVGSSFGEVEYGPGGYSSWRSVELPGSPTPLGVLALDWRPTAGGWEWAEATLSAHAGVPTVLVSHESAFGEALTGHGERIAALLAGHRQVFLVLSGHVWPSTRVRAPGREYHVINYQELPFGGAGAARLYEFDPRAGTCQVISICPALQRPELLRSVAARRLLAMSRPEDQFAFPLPPGLGGPVPVVESPPTNVAQNEAKPWQADGLSALTDVRPMGEGELMDFELELPAHFVLELQVTLPPEVSWQWQVLLARLNPKSAMLPDPAQGKPPIPPSHAAVEPLAAVSLSSENFLGWQAVTATGETWATSHEYPPGSHVTMVVANGKEPGVWVDGDPVGRTDDQLGAPLLPGEQVPGLARTVGHPTDDGPTVDGQWRWRLGAGELEGRPAEHFHGTIERFRAWG